MIGRGIAEVSEILTSAFEYTAGSAYSSLFSIGLTYPLGCQWSLGQKGQY